MVPLVNGNIKLLFLINGSRSKLQGTELLFAEELERLPTDTRSGTDKSSHWISYPNKCDFFSVYSNL